MEDEDPFGMGAPPLAEPAADAGDLGDAFGAPPAQEESALPNFDEPAGGMGDMGAAPPMDMGGMGDMGDMGAAPPMDMGGMGDMGAAPPMDMGDMGGMGDMGAAPPMDMGGMGGGLSNEFAAPMEVGAVAQWRIEQQERVSAKAQQAAAAEAEKISEAQAALQQFYAERTEKVSKRATENRAAEAEYIRERDAAVTADNWDSVCSLVDLKEKAGAEVDVSRMRSLLMQLKHVA